MEIMTIIHCITNAATGAIQGKKLGTIFDDDIPYYDTMVEAWWTKADLKLIRISNTTTQ
jgi:2C-methyl-D-erythritol 2,4-cyclodiphosphate synthase